MIFGAVCGFDKLRILNYNRYFYSKNILNAFYQYNSYKIKCFYEFFVNKNSVFKNVTTYDIYRKTFALFSRFFPIMSGDLIHLS